MSSKYPVLPPNDIIKTLSNICFSKTSQQGSYVKI